MEFPAQCRDTQDNGDGAKLFFFSFTFLIYVSWSHVTRTLVTRKTTHLTDMKK